jgi:hypothetical protein
MVQKRTLCEARLEDLPAHTEDDPRSRHIEDDALTTHLSIIQRGQLVRVQRVNCHQELLWREDGFPLRLDVFLHCLAYHSGYRRSGHNYLPHLGGRRLFIKYPICLASLYLGHSLYREVEKKVLRNLPEVGPFRLH